MSQVWERAVERKERKGDFGIRVMAFCFRFSVVHYIIQTPRGRETKREQEARLCKSINGVISKGRRDS